MLAGVLMLVMTGCVSAQHGYTTRSYQGQVLSTAAEAGARRLEIEMAYDASIRNWIAQSGKPDYILVKSRTEVLLLYIGDRRTVRFTRRFSTVGKPSVEEGISAEVSSLFSRQDQDRLKGTAPVSADKPPVGEMSRE